MIKNVLFDMGAVLVRWDPKGFLARLDVSDEDRATLEREVYRSVEWIMLDRGTLTDGEALERFYARLPERLHAAARELTLRWDDPPECIPGMLDLVGELRDKGYGLYLLSNAALRHSEYWPRYEISKFFGDRLVISSQYRILKPDREFYEIALQKFGLNPEECVFIDDNPQNCEAAMRLGIDAVVFNGAEDLRRRFKERKIL